MADERRIVTTRLSDVQDRPTDPDDVAAITRKLAKAEWLSVEGRLLDKRYHQGFADGLRWVLKHRMGVQP